MKRYAIGLVILLLAAIALAHWYYADRGRFTTTAEYEGLARQVVGQALISKSDPPLTLRFDSRYRYLGGQKFVLYGVADTEQHFFVELDDQGALLSVFWVQYEAYLPEVDYSYNYDDSPLRLSLGGLEFFTDTAAFEFDPDKPRARGTDGARVREFLALHGLSYPRQVTYARAVHLPDETRRSELMIIFMDDLARYGLSAAAVNEGGAEHARWAEIEAAHLQRLQSGIRVEPRVVVPAAAAPDGDSD